MHLTQIPEIRDPAEDDRRLVSEVLRRDRKATAEFVARCADSVYSFVRRRLAPRTEAFEDVMQEILLAAWQGLHDFRAEAGLRAWFLGIARHKVEDYYRKRIRQTEIQDNEQSSADPPLTPEFEERLDGEAQQGRVQRTLSRLPEPYALALLWRYRDEKSIREMAELTGKTEKSMERLLARARENFKKRWNDDQS
jgi:RNA polymerase sigma-70 factor (ECF subfamily)